MSVTQTARDPRSPTSVLVVDDDQDFGRAISELLTERGYQVVGQAMTARAALAECRELDPDAVLLDVRLPDGNGLVLAEALCGRAGRPRVLLTSSDRQAVARDALRQSCASGFVPKTELPRCDLDVFLRR